MDNQEQALANVQQTEIASQKSPNSFLTILLSTLLIMACIIAGFFAWQTQKLVAELRIANEELITKQTTQTPEPTLITTQEPTESASPSSTLLPTTSTNTACTMDAKICPDGSAVGRSGPKCEFDSCPTPKN